MKMKFTTAAVVLMAGVAGLLSSCKQEQSSYTMDSLQGTATITGVVKYNPGMSTCLIRASAYPAAEARLIRPRPMRPDVTRYNCP